MHNADASKESKYFTKRPILVLAWLVPLTHTSVLLLQSPPASHLQLRIVRGVDTSVTPHVALLVLLPLPNKLGPVQQGEM